MYTELEKKMYGKTKLRRKMRDVRNFLMALLGLFFITVAFTIVLDVNDAIGDGMENIRYGLFALALMISGSAIIIALLLKARK
jgi:TRAP-type C4-dicarboxylate transport system permease small subunit